MLMNKLFTQENLINEIDAELNELFELASMPNDYSDVEIDEFDVPGDNCINNIINYSKALSVRDSVVMDKISVLLN